MSSKLDRQKWHMHVVSNWCRNSILTQYAVRQSRLGRRLYGAAGFIVVYNLALLLWILLRPASENVYTTVDNLAQVVGPVAMLLVGFIWLAPGTADRGGVDAATRWASRCLALGVVADAIAQSIWNYYSLVLHQATPFPSLADVAYLSVYRLLLAGILLLVRRPLPLASRARLVLDGLMIMTAAFTLSWYFVLGPTVLQGGESLVAKTVGTAYPLMDLLLIGCVVVLATRSRNMGLNIVMILLAVSIGSYVVGDTIFDFQTLHGDYATGEWMDMTWPLADMLIVVAACILRASSVRLRVNHHPDESEVKDETETRLWPSLIPYTPVPMVGVLLLYMARTPWRRTVSARSHDRIGNSGCARTASADSGDH